VKLRKPSNFVLNWVSSYLSFFLSASTTATYILTARICRTAIVTLKPCALNPEFQHFILRFDKKFPYFVNTTERGDRGWKEAQRQGEDRVTYFTDNSTMQKIWKFLMCWEGPRWWLRASPHSGNTPSSNGLFMHNELRALKKCIMRNVKDIYLKT
jgi:hypothetical protein